MYNKTMKTLLQAQIQLNVAMGQLLEAHADVNKQTVLVTRATNKANEAKGELDKPTYETAYGLQEYLTANQICSFDIYFLVVRSRGKKARVEITKQQALAIFRGLGFEVLYRIQTTGNTLFLG